MKRLFTPKLAGIWSMEHDGWYKKYVYYSWMKWEKKHVWLCVSYFVGSPVVAEKFSKN